MADHPPAFSLSIIVGGAAIWGLVFAFVGMITERQLAGAACGVVLGAIIGLGYTKRQIGSFVVWATGFALVGMAVGPGCDADPMSSAVAAVVFFCSFRLIVFFWSFAPLVGILCVATRWLVGKKE